MVLGAAGESYAGPRHRGHRALAPSVEKDGARAGTEASCEADQAPCLSYLPIRRCMHIKAEIPFSQVFHTSAEREVVRQIKEKALQLYTFSSLGSVIQSFSLPSAQMLSRIS